MPALLTMHHGLASAGRIPRLAGARSVLNAWEIAALFLFGITAALVSAYAHVHLRIPGHTIVRSVFPMALGLALVPRQGAGVIMGIGALGTASLLQGFGGGRLGAGAMTSLCLTGPLLDAALWRARQGWRIYLGLMLAGVVSNLAALVVRGGLKELMPLPIDGRPFAEWFAQAAFTYPLCGALAGLISALVWFRFRSRDSLKEPA